MKSNQRFGIVTFVLMGAAYVSMDLNIPLVAEVSLFAIWWMGSSESYYRHQAEEKLLQK